MARTAYDAVVGQRVYRVGRPLMAGIVQQLNPVERITGMGKTVTCKGATVKWLNGEVTQEPITVLQDLLGLIEETKRKLATHQKTWYKIDVMEAR